MSTRYIVHKDEETIEVTIARSGQGYRLEIEDETVEVDSRSVQEDGVRSLLIDGRSYETALMANRGGVDVYVSGDVFHVRVTDELWARAEAAAHAGEAGHEQILSPMPGAVVTIPVELGQVVSPGDTVAVVEAMKMQNDIAAVRGGKVEEIRSQPGEVVDQGTVLVVLGPLEDDGDG
jgi:biotin carboxyl carrier protein